MVLRVKALKKNQINAKLEASSDNAKPFFGFLKGLRKMLGMINRPEKQSKNVYLKTL